MEDKWRGALFGGKLQVTKTSRFKKGALYASDRMVHACLDARGLVRAPNRAIGRKTLTRLTFDGLHFIPLWTPDGRRIAAIPFRHAT